MDPRIKLNNIDNPFQVGDWVTDICGHRMRITSLRGNFATGRYIDDEGRIHEAEGHVDMAIGVIDLSESILTALGFKPNKYGTLYLVLDGKGELNDETTHKIVHGELPHIGYDMAKKMLRIKNVDEHERNVYVYCPYLHELQHQLKDAKIEIDFDIDF